MQVQLHSSVLLGIATREGQGLGQIKDNCRGRRKKSVTQHKAQSIPQMRCLKGNSHPGLLESGHNRKTCFPSVMRLWASLPMCQGSTSDLRL